MPPDAEKFLFAMDVVQFIFKKHFPYKQFEFTETDAIKEAEKYRRYVQTHFSDNVENVLEQINEDEKDTVVEEFSAYKGELSTIILKNYVKDIRKSFNAGTGVAGKDFLYFCQSVSLMACLLFDNEVTDALDVAVELIVSAFPDDKDECKNVWNTIENAALKYRKESAKNAAAAAYYTGRREPADGISSGTEESSNSATTTESENETENKESSEAQNVSASSNESMALLSMRLEFGMLNGGSAVVAASSEGNANYGETITIADIEALRVENVSDVKSESKGITLVEDPDNNLQNPSSSTRRFMLPRADYDFEGNIKTAFTSDVKPELQSTSNMSPTKPFIIKLPSPGKAGLSLHGTIGDGTVIEPGLQSASSISPRKSFPGKPPRPRKADASLRDTMGDNKTDIEHELRSTSNISPRKSFPCKRSSPRKTDIVRLRGTVGDEAVIEPESQSTSSLSPRKSVLGKRPSPRKADTVSLRSTTDDDETEIKKPKLDSPKKSEKE